MEDHVLKRAGCGGPDVGFESSLARPRYGFFLVVEKVVADARVLEVRDIGYLNDFARKGGDDIHVDCRGGEWR